MKLEITSKHENPILNRQELEFAVSESKSTPSRKEIREKVAALSGADEKGLVVGEIKNRFGTSEISGTARVYKSEAEMRRTELKYIVTRNFGKEEKPSEKKEAAPAPEKKEK